MDWKNVLSKLAPTVASAFLGPLAGTVVSAVGDILGISEPTQEKIAQAITNGQLTGEHIAAIKLLEMKLKSEEAERGFRYAELEVRDRESARRANVDGGTLNKLFWLSLWLITTVLTAELCVLWLGVPHGVPEIIVGRILGMLDTVAAQVMNFWYGTSSGSTRKTDMMASGAKQSTG